MTDMKTALRVLQETSRSFFIPINSMPSILRTAVTSAYLCLRAVDEVEDHALLDSGKKIEILSSLSWCLQTADNEYITQNLQSQFQDFKGILPEVTIDIGKWLMLAPKSIGPRIWNDTSVMADRMAEWVRREWEIESPEDLDRYTFMVAGSVGLLLSDIWNWYDGTQSDRSLAVAYGKGLQTVNILLNQDEDLSRGVDFFPNGWKHEDMIDYASEHLALAAEYVAELPSGPIEYACRIPLTLALAAIEALKKGERKLTRSDVARLLSQLAQGE